MESLQSAAIIPHPIGLSPPVRRAPSSGKSKSRQPRLDVLSSARCRADRLGGLSTMRPAWLISFVLVAMSLLCAPLWARFGVVKTQARFAMYHPPAFHAYGHEIRLQVDSLDMRNGVMLAPRIQHLLEEGLARHGFR